MSVKINKLEIENVKRVKAVAIEPTQNGLTILGGNNNKGKDKDYCKTQKTSSYYDSNSSKNRRRAVEVHTTSAEDYETAF